MTASPTYNASNGDTRADRMRVSKVFIVDSHPATREGLAARLGAEPDFEVCGEAGDLAAALDGVAATAPDVVVIDFALNRGEGLELVKRLKDRGCPAKMLMWSWRNDTIYAERALRAGAVGFISKDAATATVIGAIRRVRSGDVYLSPEMTSLVVRRNVAGGGTLDAIEGLSGRELEVFRLTGHGVDTAKVAEKMGVSPKTVETYKARIKEKLGLDTSSELLVRAVRWVIENN